MNDEQLNEYCPKCDRLQPVRCTRCEDGFAWFCTGCGNMTDSWDLPVEPEEIRSDDNDY